MNLIDWHGIHPIFLAMLPIIGIFWLRGLIACAQWVMRRAWLQRLGAARLPLVGVIMVPFTLIPLFPLDNALITGHLNQHVLLIYCILVSSHATLLGIGIAAFFRWAAEHISLKQLAWPVKTIKRKAPVDNERRKLMGIICAGIPPLFIGTVFANANAGNKPALAERYFSFNTRSRKARYGEGDQSWMGLRISVFSDLHMGFFFPDGILHDILFSIQGFNPDLILFVGDLVDHDIADAEETRPFWRQLTGMAPVYSVLGNHDVWSGRSTIAKWERDNGICLLQDEAVSLRGKRGEVYALCGAKDLDEEPPRCTCLDRVPPGIPTILMAHNPDTLLTLETSRRPALTVSGHTHGGQIRMPGIGSLVNQADSSFQPGFCRHRNHLVLLTAGVGYAVLPLRMNCPPEVVHLTLCNT